MKKGNILAIMIFIIGIAGAVQTAVANDPFTCKGFSINFDTRNKLQNHSIGLCKIQGTIKAEYNIDPDTLNLKAKTINFTPIAHFGNCVAGLGRKQITFTTFDRAGVCPALRTKTIESFRERFDENKTRNPKNNWRGRF